LNFPRKKEKSISKFDATIIREKMGEISNDNNNFLYAFQGK
jgi:hypothetical protein